MRYYEPFLQKAKALLPKQVYDGHVYLFYADFSEFKLVNFLYGEAAGDALLQAARDCLEEIPTVVLYDNFLADQFLLLVMTPKDWTDGDMLADYKKYVVQFLTQQRPLYPKYLFRIYSGVCPVQDGNLVKAIDCANAGRMQARRNQSAEPVLFDTSMWNSAKNLMQVSGKVNLALREERFTFYLQPQVELATGRIVSAEALARQIAEDGSILCPSDFIPAMESSGRVVDLDLLIFQKVCRHLALRLGRGRPVVQISVNLSRRHIQNEETAAMLHETARQYHIPANLIGFELVETIPPEELCGAKRLLDQLRTYGYKASIDDFGSGYAGIGIWQELDFDVLKLDRSFLSDEEPRRSKNMQIVPNLIKIAQGLNLRLLCEGLERAEQCRWLYQMGCQLAQGYYFSPPVPAEEFYRVYEEKGGYFPLESHLA